ncbi:MAG: glycosyltransferase family 4 protein [Candidatus Geothermincolia bacterium]
MRVLTASLNRRGGEPVFGFELARAMARQAELEAIVSAQAENLEAWKTVDFPVHVMDTYSGVVSGALSLVDVRRFARARSIARRFSPDVVHQPTIQAWSPLRNAVAFGPFPRVITVHDPHPHLGEKHRGASHVLGQATMRQAHRLVILSESLRPDMRAMGFDDETVDVIPHGEFSYYSRLAGGASIEESERRRTLLFFGRLREYKGLGVLGEAFPMVKQRVPDARLLIVCSGDFGPYRERFAAMPGVEVVNEFVPDAEVGSWFARAGILVLPYVEASQSGVVTIAYSMGMPAVASAVGGLAEQVVDGETGFLVPPSDPAALADRLARLMLEDNLYRRQSEGARRFSETAMSWDRIAELTLASCAKAIAGARACR